MPASSFLNQQALNRDKYGEKNPNPNRIGKVMAFKPGVCVLTEAHLAKMGERKFNLKLFKLHSTRKL